MKNIKHAAEEYVCSTKTYGLIAKDILEGAYTRGAADALEELTRYFGNVMPPYYQNLLKEKTDKMKEK